jgi:LacI family transcriptional regulator
MPVNRVTLKDIAKQIGLSTATISRALADHPDISGETKERVREAAQARKQRGELVLERQRSVH